MLYATRPAIKALAPVLLAAALCLAMPAGA